MTSSVMAGMEEAVLRGYELIDDEELAKLYSRAEEAGIKRETIKFELPDREAEEARDVISGYEETTSN